MESGFKNRKYELCVRRFQGLNFAMSVVSGNNVKPIRELPSYVAGETVWEKFHIFYGRP